MIEVVNRQRKRKLKTERFAAFGKSCLRELGREAGGVTIALVSDRAMQMLNQEFRGKRATTDVLSFPAGERESFEAGEDVLGDIVIAVEQAARQAEENGLGFENEIEELILHGMLHLCGYDHERDNGEMNRLERRLRKRLADRWKSISR